jgi:hypothetical protein
VLGKKTTKLSNKEGSWLPHKFFETTCKPKLESLLVHKEELKRPIEFKVTTSLRRVAWNIYKPPSLHLTKDGVVRANHKARRSNIKQTTLSKETNLPKSLRVNF